MNMVSQIEEKNKEHEQDKDDLDLIRIVTQIEKEKTNMVRPELSKSTFSNPVFTGCKIENITINYVQK